MIEGIPLRGEIMKRQGSAVWTGGLKDGRGTVSTESGALSEKQYSFSARFENGVGTNPEELIGAAHAGCFSMALSGQLGAAGMTAERIKTTATVSLEKLESGFAITGIHLDLLAKIPGADAEKFRAAAAAAKEGCPVSKALKVPITLDAKLEG
jgi:lipoyl-dependent peroxiredoxin